MKVKLHPAESLLNKLTHAERKRSGSLLQRQKAGFDILCEALAQAKAKGAAEEREAILKELQVMSCGCSHKVRARGGKP